MGGVCFSLIEFWGIKFKIAFDFLEKFLFWE